MKQYEGNQFKLSVDDNNLGLLQFFCMKLCDWSSETGATLSQTIYAK